MGDEVKTDAEQMSDIINEVSVAEPVLSTEYEQPNALTAEIAPKLKRSHSALLESSLL